LALLVHLLFVTAYRYRVELRKFFGLPELEAKKLVLKKKKKNKHMDFMILEDSPEEELKPEDATARAKISRKAKDLSDKQKPVSKVPEVADPSKHKVSMIGKPVPDIPDGVKSNPVKDLRKKPPRPVKDKPEKKVEPEPEIERQKAELVDTKHKKEIRVPELVTAATPENKTSPFAMLPKPMKSTAPVPDKTTNKNKKTEEAKKPAKKKYVFKKIGQKKPKSGNKAFSKNKGAAEIQGALSYATLKIKYADYIDTVFRKLFRSFRVVESLHRHSYRTGTIVFVFGIKPDGSLSKCKIVRWPEEMISEKNMCEEAIRTAAPFPPLKPEMMKDLELFNNIGFRVHF
jgi:hypothetical protein